MANHSLSFLSLLFRCLRPSILELSFVSSSPSLIAAWMRASSSSSSAALFPVGWKNGSFGTQGGRGHRAWFLRWLGVGYGYASRLTRLQLVFEMIEIMLQGLRLRATYLHSGTLHAFRCEVCLSTAGTVWATRRRFQTDESASRQCIGRNLVSSWIWLRDDARMKMLWIIHGCL